MWLPGCVGHQGAVLSLLRHLERPRQPGFRALAPGSRPDIKKFQRFLGLRGFPSRAEGGYQPSVADSFGAPHEATGPDGTKG
eukprot:10654359-Alexandrium_andersonii.AAC.1